MKIKSDYVLISQGGNIGNVTDTVFLQRRDGNRFIDVGVAKIVKKNNNRVVAKIVNAYLPVKVGDDVKPGGDDWNFNESFSGQTTPANNPLPKNSFGVKYRLISFIGDDKDNFDEQWGAEIFLSRSLGKHFFVKGLFMYNYVEWFRLDGYQLSQGILLASQYAEAEGYSIGFAPGIQLPLLNNRFVFSAAPIVGYSASKAWIEVQISQFNTWYNDFTMAFEDETDFKSNIWFGAEANCKFNITKSMALEAGVKWENVDIMKGFTEYEYTPSESMPTPSDDFKVTIDTKTLIMNFGLTINF